MRFLRARNGSLTSTFECRNEWDLRARPRNACRGRAARGRRGRARRGARGPRPGGCRRHRRGRGCDQDHRRGGNAARPDRDQPFGSARRRAHGIELPGWRAPGRRDISRPPSRSRAQGSEAHRRRWGAAARRPAREDDRSGASSCCARTQRFEPGEIAGAELAAAHVALVLRAFGAGNGAGSSPITSEATLSLAGDALAAGLGQARNAEEVVGVAARASGAEAALLWVPDDNGALELLTATGSAEAQAAAPSQAGLVPQEREPVRLEALTDGSRRTVASLGLGQPPLGVLQLVFAPGVSPSQRELERLGTFSVRAAHALRAGERARETSIELEHAQALLAVIGQAIAELSLAHTVKTAITRVSELLGADRVAVYLRDGSRLQAATGRELSSAELMVAERLLELAFGPLRAQGMLHVPDAQADLRLGPVREAVAEAGIGAALAVPLVAREELVGLLAAYLPRGRELSANESSLLSALANQLAVAAQNARLHERTERLATEREEALAAEREAAKRLRALYEISRSFAQSLSLDATLDAVTAAAVDLLEADAAVIRMEDGRGRPAGPSLDTRRRSSARGAVAPAAHAGPGRGAASGPAPLPDGQAARPRSSGARSASAPRTSCSSRSSNRARPRSSSRSRPPRSSSRRSRSSPSIRRDASARTRSRPPSSSPGRPRSRSTTHASTSSRRISRTRCSGRSCHADCPSSRASRSAPSTSRRPASRSAATSTTSSRCPTGSSRSCSGDASGHGVAATADMALAKFVFRSLVRLYPDPASS